MRDQCECSGDSSSQARLTVRAWISLSAVSSMSEAGSTLVCLFVAGTCTSVAEEHCAALRRREQNGHTRSHASHSRCLTCPAVTVLCDVTSIRRHAGVVWCGVAVCALCSRGQISHCFDLCPRAACCVLTVWDMRRSSLRVSLCRCCDGCCCRLCAVLRRGEQC